MNKRDRVAVYAQAVVLCNARYERVWLSVGHFEVSGECNRLKKQHIADVRNSNVAWIAGIKYVSTVRFQIIIESGRINFVTWIVEAVDCGLGSAVSIS